MNDTEYYSYIEEHLNILSYRIKTRAKINILDLNLHSEDFFAELFNLIYDKHFVNLNSTEQNAAGFDLIDEENKIIAQVTSNVTKQKVDSSLNQDIFKDSYSGYTFWFIAVTDSADILRRKNYKNPHALSFNPEENIFDMPSILKDISTLKIKKLEAVYNFIKNELGAAPESDIHAKPEMRLVSNFIPNDDEVIGRNEELQEISAALNQDYVVFIRGMGGVGKSALAKKYAQEHEREYNIIIEVSADSFRSTIANIEIENWNADGLDDETIFSSKLQVIKNLMSSVKVLLIVHDYNISSDPESQWSDLPCKCVITTRNYWKGACRRIPIDINFISSEDAVQIFNYYYLQNNHEYHDILTYYLDTDVDAVSELIYPLECHVLSIKLLAKQMSCNPKELIRPAEMLKKFKNEYAIIFQNTPESENEDFPKHSTIVQLIQKMFSFSCETGRLSKEHLRALKFMLLTSPATGISSNRFITWTNMKSQNILEQLKNGGWLELNENEIDYLDESQNRGIYRLSNIVAEVLLEEKVLKRSITSSKNMINAFMNCDLHDLTSYKARYCLNRQAQAIALNIPQEVSLKYSELLYKAGTIIFDTAETLAERTKGLEYQEKAQQISKRISRENHLEIADAYNNLGTTYEKIGAQRKNLEYQERSLEIQRKELGENHPDTAISYNNIGMIYAEAGEFRKGLDYLEKALDIRKRVLGENHPDTAASYSSLGLTYREIGNLSESLEYLQKALVIRKKVFGENHPDTAASYDNLGLICQEMSKLPESLEYFQKALVIRRKVLGEDHPDTAVSYNNIGIIYEKLGYFHNSRMYLEKAFEIRMRVFGEDHLETARSYDLLSQCYKELGEPEKSRQYQEKALEITRSVLGKTNQEAFQENVKKFIEGRFELKYLEINQFHDIKNIKIDFSEKITIFIGQNGCGKSSILEALYQIFGALESEALSASVSFNYTLKYVLDNVSICIKKDKERYSVWINTERKKPTFSGKISSVKDKIKDAQILPKHVVTFYAGLNDRINSIYNRLTTNYRTRYTKVYKEYINSIAEYSPSFESIENRRYLHCDNELLPVYLAFALNAGEIPREYIKQFCNIQDLSTVCIYIEIPFNYQPTVFIEKIKRWIKKLNPKFKEATNKDLITIEADADAQLKISIDIPSLFIYSNDIIIIFSYLEKLLYLAQKTELTILFTDGNTMDHIKASYFSEGQNQWIKIIGMLTIAKYSQGFVLMDEPDAFMNPRWKYDLFDVITKVTNANCSILLVTHDPLVINGVSKDNIRLVQKNIDNSLGVEIPEEETRGMGIDGILQSSYYGLSTSYDRETADLYKRRMELYIKLIHNEITSEEKYELTELSDNLSRLPSAYNSMDFLYYDFLHEYMKSDYYDKRYLSREELKNKRNKIKEIIESLYTKKQ